MSTTPKLPADQEEFLAAMNAIDDPSHAYTAFPKELRRDDVRAWVLWKKEKRYGKMTKIPYQTTGEPAAANNPETWTTFAHALAVLKANPREYAGIGIELGGVPFLKGIDLDGMAPNGVPDAYATSILKLLGNSYAELSVNGNGLHIFDYSTMSLTKNHFTGKGEHFAAEIYEDGRFFTVSGNQLAGSGNTVAHIEDISIAYFLLEQVGDKKFESFRRYWIGDCSEKNGDESRADEALMCILAKKFRKDTTLMEKYFSASALGQREKWTTREDYRKSTIQFALDHTTIDYPRGGESHSEELVFHLPAVPPKSSFDYVIAPLPESHSKEGWFPRGAVSLIGAPSGGGKTTLMYQMLMAQAAKAKFFGHDSYGKPFQILAIDRGNADHERTMYSLRLPIDALPFRYLKLDSDRAAVQEIINQIETCTPLPEVLLVEGVDYMVSNVVDSRCVSAFMYDLNRVARHFDLAVIGVIGAPKVKIGQGYAAVRDNFLGSGAWGRFSETMLNLQYPKNDDTEARRKLFVMLRHEANEQFTLEFQSGRLVVVADEEISDHQKDSAGAEIQWFKKKAQEAKTPADKWWTALDFQREFNLAHSTTKRHLDDELTKNHIRVKPGKKHIRGGAREYCWNESGTNPIWVKEQEERAHEQLALLQN